MRNLLPLPYGNGNCAMSFKDITKVPMPRSQDEDSTDWLILGVQLVDFAIYLRLAESQRMYSFSVNWNNTYKGVILEVRSIEVCL